jgi:hypothetical protein
MTQQAPYSNQKFNQTLSTEQLNQIIEAILEGKYSWACVLLLRCSGYNPVHYIPYRTYNRLLKENCQFGNTSSGESNKSYHVNNSPQTKSNGASGNHLSLISDLPYVEDLSEQNKPIRGGELRSFASNLPLKWLSKFKGFFGGSW